MEIRTPGPAVVTSRPSASITPSIEPVDLLATEQPVPPGLARVSWGAILAGAAVASVIAIVLNLIGMAIGLAAFDPGDNSAKAFGIVAAVWMFVTSAVALFWGGSVAGWASAMPERKDRALHAVVTWSVAMLAGVAFITAGATRAVAGTASVLGNVASAAAPQLQQAVQQLDLPPELEDEMSSVVAELKTDRQLRASVIAVVQGDATPQERERLIDEVGQRTGRSRAEIDADMNRWAQNYRETKAMISRKAETSANVLSVATLISVSSMLLGLSTCVLGAVMTAPAASFTRRRTVVSRANPKPTT